MSKKHQIKILIVLNDQGGAAMNWNYKGISATLRASMNSHYPIVVIENEADNNDRKKIF